MCVCLPVFLCFFLCVFFSRRAREGLGGGVACVVATPRRAGVRFPRGALPGWPPVPLLPLSLLLLVLLLGCVRALRVPGRGGVRVFTCFFVSFFVCFFSRRAREGLGGVVACKLSFSRAPEMKNNTDLLACGRSVRTRVSRAGCAPVRAGARRERIGARLVDPSRPSVFGFPAGERKRRAVSSARSHHARRPVPAPPARGGPPAG